ncbi:hypothetical protein Clacol_002538 [Clathrus columnatus]|uniref:C3H1-type domain-containing protein n=1 Tax=Clathrus columnatus TaxID=1419009 RepID=A0AAV5A124_9AGAM|nr:hypothetical protein Clacol_002538 [Clathrus columnatus]
MPPKKQPTASGSKTFGMKNKKGAKAQKHVQQIQKQAATTGKSKEDLAKEKEKELRAREKAEEEKRRKENAELFKPVQVQQKIPFGVDPKTILCAYFKAGSCDKGNRCKFSHNLEVGRKVEKKNLYEDARDAKENGEIDFLPPIPCVNNRLDTMDNWDEQKLRDVVLSKAGNPRTTTDVINVPSFGICKLNKQNSRLNFAIIIEEIGDNCQYRHALPPGFVLKSEKKAKEEAEKANTISLEEFLETERHRLGPNLTPVTPETFAIWKQNRLSKKEAEAEALQKAKAQSAAAGKSSGLSGRDLFQYNPEWFQDDDETAEDDWDLRKYRIQHEEERAATEAERLARLQLDEPDNDNASAGENSASGEEENDIEGD